MSAPALHIDFVSDIACPWCAVGLNSLEQALERLRADGIAATLQFHPFELNPQMGPEGEDIVPHLQAKYGISEAQIAQNRETLRQRGLAVGFEFGPRARIWNTFDAHRLLHAAQLLGNELQHRLKRSLLQAYQGRGDNPADAAVLRACANEAGLPAETTEALLRDPQLHADAVRAEQAQWQASGIRAVPAVVVNHRHLISGGQPPEVFERALREIAAAA
jgi:predicted DsbA family dithiol-disulfide isomerase